MKRILCMSVAIVLTLTLGFMMLPSGIIKAAYTIQDAINAANPGDVVSVPIGVYNEHLTINKPLTLTGENREFTILDGPGLGYGIHIEGTTEVNINNLTIRDYASGIRLENSDNSIITDNTILDNYHIPAYVSCGIEIRGSTDNLVTNNIFLNNEFAIYLNNHSEYNLIEGNTVQENVRGIYIYNCAYNTILGNNISNNTVHGVNFDIASNHNSIIGNTIQSNLQNGIYFMGSAISSNNNTIQGNDISYNETHGIFHNYRSWNDTIAGNYVHHNAEKGILLHYNIYNPKVYNNTVEANGVGMRLWYVHDGEVYNNNFINNTKQVEVSMCPGTLLNLEKPIGGNYWSDWTTPNIDPDPRFVDIRYTIWGYGYDELPWAEENGWLSTYNQPPVADAGIDQTVEANAIGGANVTLDGSGSSDADGDPLTYDWNWDGGTTDGMSPTIFLPLGTTSVTLVVNDGTEDSAPDTVEITIQDTTPPEITITSPEERDYLRTEPLVIDFDVADICSAVAYSAILDGDTVSNGQIIDLLLLTLGSHTLTVNAEDSQGNVSDPVSVTFDIVANADSLLLTIEQMFDEGLIDNPGIVNSLLSKITNALDKIDQGKTMPAENILNAFINYIHAQTGKHISQEAAAILIADAEYIIANL
ncbi:NosD domain-containing protein [Chloroflexota bacterium]